MFWQIFYALPFYVKDVLHYGRFEVIETVDAWGIILFTMPATALAKRLRPIRAMTLGFALATASWFLMGSVPTLTATVAAILVFAIGEATQAPRYYEYVADLAPPEQVGTYMGYAFLPIAIGTFLAGATAGPLVSHYIGTRVGRRARAGAGRGGTPAHVVLGGRHRRGLDDADAAVRSVRRAETRHRDAVGTACGHACRSCCSPRTNSGGSPSGSRRPPPGCATPAAGSPNRP